MPKRIQTQNEGSCQESYYMQIYADESLLPSELSIFLLTNIANLNFAFHLDAKKKPIANYASELWHSGVMIIWILLFIQ